MDEQLFDLKDAVIQRKQQWEDAKEPQHAVSIFVCNRRIRKLDEALKLISEIELIEESTRM